MPVFYITTQGDALLSLDAIEKIAAGYNAMLMAVDSIDLAFTNKNNRQIPLKKEGEQRTYLFTIEASDVDDAQSNANTILREAVEERDTPTYHDLLKLLDDTSIHHASLEARYVQDEYGERTDLLITRPGLGNTPAHVYYRGDIGYACLELLKRFSTIVVKE